MVKVIDLPVSRAMAVLMYPKTSFPFGKVAIKNIFMSKSVDQHIHA